MSNLTRIMTNGQKKVRTTKKTRLLLGEMSKNNHMLIAQLIARWLDED